MSGQTHILVVEDDPVTRSLLAGYFGQEGYRVSELADGNEAAALLRNDPADLLLLDIRLPGIDGLTLTRELRAQSEVGIILVTSKKDTMDRIIGLELGADDYVTKPFEPRELLARVKNLLRRVGHAPKQNTGSCLRFENWQLDTGRHLLSSPTTGEVRLTEGEFRLLYTLVNNAGRTLSRDQLMSHLHGRDWTPSDRAVDVLLGRLRKKLGDDPQQPRLIATVRGSGYLFTATVSHHA